MLLVWVADLFVFDRSCLSVVVDVALVNRSFGACPQGQ